MDGMGAPAFVALCERLAQKHGARFAPPQILRDMAKDGTGFYARFAAGRKKAA